MNFFRKLYKIIFQSKRHVFSVIYKDQNDFIVFIEFKDSLDLKIIDSILLNKEWKENPTENIYNILNSLLNKKEYQLDRIYFEIKSNVLDDHKEKHES